MLLTLSRRTGLFSAGFFTTDRNSHGILYLAYKPVYVLWEDLPTKVVGLTFHLINEISEILRRDCLLFWEELFGCCLNIILDIIEVPIVTKFAIVMAVMFPKFIIANFVRLFFILTHTWRRIHLVTYVAQHLVLVAAIKRIIGFAYLLIRRIFSKLRILCKALS